MCIKRSLAICVVSSCVVWPGTAHGDVLAVDPVFPLTQIGQHGDIGRGGSGGTGNRGGYGGGYNLVTTGANLGWTPYVGEQGIKGGIGNRGGTGGTGGQGVLVIEGMDPGASLTNFGEVLLGGEVGVLGDKGITGVKGGAGGHGGAAFFGGAVGLEPNPDPWPATQQGGARGLYLGNGHDGVNAGGGGGGGDAGVVYNPGFPLFGDGGDGGDGFTGAKGAGGLGTHGDNESVVLSTDGTLAPNSMLQIGGSGGRGGKGGQGGSGSGGGGGAGSIGNIYVIIPFIYNPTAGGAGGAGGSGGPAGYGGAGGDGVIVIGDRGRFVNEQSGSIRIGHSLGMTSGTLQVQYGGQLVNHGSIVVQDGSLLLDHHAYLNNQGSIDSSGVSIITSTAATVINDGIITTPLFENNGFLSGTGLIAGDLVNYLEFAPGNSTGVFSVDGNYSEQFRLVIELASIADYDSLTVSGNVTFGSLASLHLDFIEGFGENELVDNDAFDLIRYHGELLGRFGSINDSEAPLTMGSSWDLDYAHDLGEGWSSVRLIYHAVPSPASLVMISAGLVLIAIPRPSSKRRNSH